LPTILSRCQRFDLRRIPVSLISNHLSEIAKKEKVRIEPAALQAIARGAEGAMRDAESTLDQLISFCGEKIEETDVLSMFGLTGQGQILDLSQAVLSGEIEKALRLLNDLAHNGKDLGRLLSDLLNHFRNLLIFQVARGDKTILEVSEAEAAALGEQSKQATTEGLTRIMEVLADAEMRLRDTASKKILVEVALLKAIEARNAVSLDSVLKQLQGLRDGTSGEAATAAAASAPAQAPARGPRPVRAEAAAEIPAEAIQTVSMLQPEVAQIEPAQAPSAAPQSAELENLWTLLLEAVGRQARLRDLFA